MAGEGKVACVTGASGYIASWIVKLLLERGYTVRASVTNLKDPAKTRHLTSLDGAMERLHFFEANLLEDGSFDLVVNGCECVFHAASPVLFFPTDPQLELLEPALKGTLNVLRSCTKSDSIKRVILTSSLAAVAISEKALTRKSIVDIDETWFSDPVFCKESKAWYMLSKTLAEEAAWKFAKENGIDLVTTNAGFVIGPMLQPTLNSSVEMILTLINGKSKVYPNMLYQCVDVRDVAMAHILAFEVQSASGRYCLVAHSHHYAHILDTTRKLYPSLDVAQTCEDEEPLQFPFTVSKEKAERLGIKFTSLEVTLRDTIESLKDKGFFNI